MTDTEILDFIEKHQIHVNYTWDDGEATVVELQIYASDTLFDDVIETMIWNQFGLTLRDAVEKCKDDEFFKYA